MSYDPADYNETPADREREDERQRKLWYGCETPGCETEPPPADEDVVRCEDCHARVCTAHAFNFGTYVVCPVCLQKQTSTMIPIVIELRRLASRIENTYHKAEDAKRIDPCEVELTLQEILDRVRSVC